MGRLHRSRRHRVLGGVAGGLAETLGVPAWLVRGLLVLALIPWSVPVLLLYLLAWLVLPQRDEPPGGPWARPGRRR